MTFEYVSLSVIIQTLLESKCDNNMDVGPCILKYCAAWLLHHKPDKQTWTLTLYIHSFDYNS